MIATVTLNPAVDQTVTVDGELTDDDVTRVEDARFDAGGKGINVSEYLTEMGVETVATGILGGFLGDFIADSLAADGIRTEFVDIEAGTRLNTTVHTAATEYKLNQRGPTVDPSVVDEIVATLDEIRPEILVIGGSLPPGLDSGAIDKLADAGPWKTAVDVDGRLLQQLEATYEWCKPNGPELETATGREISTVDDAIAAADELRRQGFGTVVASLGADGAALVSETMTVHEPPIDCEVVDTVGAGDALFAGFLAALDAGEDPESALETGVVTASAAVTTVGTTIPSLPTP